VLCKPWRLEEQPCMNKFYTLGVEAHSIVLGLVNEDLFVCGKKNWAVVFLTLD